MNKTVIITKAGSGRGGPGGKPCREGESVTMKNDVAEMFIGYGWAYDPDDDGSPKIMTTEGPQSQSKLKKRGRRRAGVAD